MPSLPLDQCATYHCKAPSIKGSVYCLDHAPTVKPSPDRQSFNAPYKTQTWARIRARQLSAHPLCQACQLLGLVTHATHVDHLFAWASIGHQAFTRNVFQSLCPDCHGIKSGMEKKGVFRHYVNPARDYSLGDYSLALALA